MFLVAGGTTPDQGGTVDEKLSVKVVNNASIDIGPGLSDVNLKLTYNNGTEASLTIGKDQIGETVNTDISYDEASMVTGSIGMLASASLNETRFGLYEPSGGSAPDIAGQGIANPIATILSAAMMLRFSLDQDKAADAIEAAVSQVLKDGYRTGDIMSDGCTKVGTARMGDLICERIR